MSGPYVPLRVFSSFTMLEGAIEPKAIAKQAKKLGFPAVALADRNGLYAAMPFGDACFAEGVQPIIGAMLAVARPEDIGPAAAIDWLVLLAQDEVGYGNLCRLVSSAHLDRPIQEEPHVSFEMLAGQTDGLIALTAAGEGAIALLLPSQEEVAVAGGGDPGARAGLGGGAVVNFNVGPDADARPREHPHDRLVVGHVPGRFRRVVELPGERELPVRVHRHVSALNHPVVE